MTKNVENINEICKRYANALILSSQDRNELKIITENFEHFNKVLSTSNDLSTFIKNPLVNSQKKSFVKDLQPTITPSRVKIKHAYL